jgi:hypothetical protein
MIASPAQYHGSSNVVTAIGTHERRMDVFAAAHIA